MEEYKIHSVHTGQDYAVQIQKPLNYEPVKAYTLVYVADGSYGIGKFLPDTQNNIAIPGNCLIISIGHTGNIEADRNRDFIPSDISHNDKKDYGRASEFYLFIRDELLPFMASKFPACTKKVFIGHSLSGLFCLYLTFQPEQLFDHYYAISPSVWANRFELLKIEKEYSKRHKDFQAAITIYAGSLEIFNLIRISVYRFVTNISARNYPGLKLSYVIIPNVRHFTIRKPALEQIMNSLKQ